MTERVLTTALPVSWRDYLMLCKPRVTGLLVFTALVGMLLARPDEVPAVVYCAAVIGIGAMAAGAAAINHVADHRIDALMARTRRRPIPHGEITRAQGLGFAAILGLTGAAVLVAFVNVLTALLTFVSFIGYALIYTLYLKRATPQNIVIGGAAGAAPPVLGWTAVTNQIDPHALLLFLIIFAWTPPHFWSLAIYRRNDYARADVPMLPVTHGVDYTRIQILLYTVLMVLATLLPYVTYMSGVVYLCGVLALDFVFLYFAIRMLFDRADALALTTFRYSIVYLAGVFLLLSVDRYLPLVLPTG
jgi:protoheme IX farnesyltransferase